jgi:hypothetical protein
MRVDPAPSASFWNRARSSRVRHGSRRFEASGEAATLSHPEWLALASGRRAWMAKGSSSVVKLLLLSRNP